MSGHTGRHSWLLTLKPNRPPGLLTSKPDSWLKSTVGSVDAYRNTPKTLSFTVAASIVRALLPRRREDSPMTFNPEEWGKLSERQRQAIIRKIEREEKRAKTVIVVMVYILVFAFLLFLFAVMSSCPTPQYEAPTGQEDEIQAQHRPSRACDLALSSGQCQRSAPETMPRDAYRERLEKFLRENDFPI